MTQTPNIPPIIESEESDYRDSGVPSTVAIAGHPIHPLIVLFPIAFLVGAAGSDLGYWLTTDPFWARASIWLIGVGLLSSAPAVLTGLSDFFGIERVRKRTAGWAHLGLNVVAIALSIINYLLRFGDPAKAILPWGLAISIVVATVLGLSGWYGAELIYRHKVAVIGYGTSGDPSQ
ncbi:MAG TPA: DUF2231 domain-containing protein [Candidatus Caenarcaniphilales bacterium]